MIDKSVKLNKRENAMLTKTDYALWIEETVNLLKEKNYQNVDWENLIEEIESLGRSDRQKVRSFLRQLLAHLLKRCYLPLPQEFHHWEVEIRNFRVELQDIFDDSPSLKRYANEVLPNCWQVALEGVRQEYKGFDFPDQYPFAEDIKGILHDTFWVEQL